MAEKEEKVAKNFIPTGTGMINEARLRKEHRQYALEQQTKGEPYEDDYERWKASLSK